MGLSYWEISASQVNRVCKEEGGASTYNVLWNVALHRMEEIKYIITKHRQEKK
jgi:hypothetical protein